MCRPVSLFFISWQFAFFLLFFFNDTATTEIYTLSLHDALPISKDALGQDSRGRRRWRSHPSFRRRRARGKWRPGRRPLRDRKSTRLNSSHQIISYAVFCLKKKKRTQPKPERQSPQRSISGFARL